MLVPEEETISIDEVEAEVVEETTTAVDNKPKGVAVPKKELFTADFKVGDIVRIKEGLHTGEEGKVQDMDYSKGVAFISIEMFWTEDLKMAFTELKHPLIVDKLTRMRKIETSSKDFRENLNEIAQLMVYEIFRDLELEPIELQPLLQKQQGMLDGIQRLIPTAKVAHIGLFRDEETLEIHQYYAKQTEDIANSHVIIVDPMLATGVAVQPGIDKVLKEHPDVEIYSASLDKELQKNGYISPGLGDAGIESSERNNINTGISF
ncbi:hypothetical protein FQA39_LY12788 [Lamprigera yunnana]|nr:hypothetical protein FQA39_LY12788 [Lamprigera yunnana]